MATAVAKQKKTFKESVKETGAKAKAYAKKQGEKVKTYGKKYGADLRTAYDVGYKRGWDDAYDIDTEDRPEIVYTDRFRKPEWIK